MASTLNLLTLPEAKAAVTNNAGDTNDDLLAAYITGVSKFLDRICGPVVQRDITGELKDGGHNLVFLNYRPVVSVAAVTEYCGASPTELTERVLGEALPAQGFILRKAGGWLSRTSAGSPAAFAFGTQNVTVDYTAGRFTDTADVDELFKRAAGLVLSNIYRREHGRGTNPDGLLGATYMLPNAAKALLADDLQIRQ
jgi:hypothetical protein